MRKFSGLMGGSLVGILLLASQAYGIDTVRAIQINPDTVQLVITGTVAGATIEWQGVGTNPPTSAASTYTGLSDVVPGNCLGTVSDGIMTIPNVEVEFCTVTIFAGVPVTGQTTSYAPGDDGDLQEGIEWPVPRFTDNLDGTVTDNMTDLTWLQDFNCLNVLVTWNQALDAIDDLNATGMMGATDCGDTSNGGSFQTDWRLPNVREYESLIDYGANAFALPPNPFLNIAGGQYWTSTTYAADTTRAYIVRLLTGERLARGKANLNNKFLTAVRGGPE